MIEAFLIVTILFGGWQYNRAERLEDKVEQFQEVNETNARTIDYLDDSIDACNQAQMEQLDKINQFREVGEINRAAIQTLEISLAGSDFSECVVPDNINFQTGIN